MQNGAQMQAYVLRLVKNHPHPRQCDLAGVGVVLFLDQNLNRARQGTIRAIKGKIRYNKLRKKKKGKKKT